MNDQKFITEFKSRFRIFHSSEDDDIGRQLEDSFSDIKSLIGTFEADEFPKGKELVYERTRYLRNEALEYFYGNFQTMIMDASIDLAGEIDYAD
ncbi:phage gp6-like head-tail connector protein [Enterococcus sp. AZ189]|uniref:phage gp6-like head-tail connector protein n=1 Tax=Enterococcus sp. AZ189 TaxID=2774871 RepID=UPI003F26E2F6